MADADNLDALPPTVSRAALAAAVRASSDVALVLDRDGVVLHVWGLGGDAPPELLARWVGRPWRETVTVESRAKVDELLAGARAGEAPRLRHLNHPVPRRPDLALLYAVTALEGSDLVLAAARDLGPVAALQQQLVRAQQALETDYERLREAEARYRTLFRVSSDGVLLVDADTRRIAEANPAASEILGLVASRAVGRPFPEGLEPDDARALHAMLDAVVVGADARPVVVRLAGRQSAAFRVSAALFREAAAHLLLVRLAALAASAPDEVGEADALALELLRTLPDGFAVTERDGRILLANDALLQLLQLPTEDAARRHRLDRYLGRFDIDFDVLTAALRQGGVVRLFATRLRGEQGALADVEISGVAAAPAADPPAYGFLVRDVGRRLSPPTSTSEPLASADQLAEQVGRLPLKDIVGQTGELIERHCIRAALRMTGDNRAAAAELLGLSRQSLYVKLRRYGLADADLQDEDA